MQAKTKNNNLGGLTIFLLSLVSFLAFGNTNLVEVDLFGDQVDSFLGKTVVTTKDHAFEDSRLRSAMIGNLNEFKVFYERKGTTYYNKEIESFFNKIAAKELISEEEWLSSFGYFTHTSCSRIQNNAVLELLVAGLYGESAAIKEKALNKLMWEVGHKSRAKYAADIKNALSVRPDRIEGKYLVAKGDLSPKEKQQMLLSVSSNDKLLRALCGDTEAEKEIIRIFRDTTNFEEKQKWVRPLAFIGSSACEKALIEGLNSTMFKLSSEPAAFFDGPDGGSVMYEYVFIRDPILKELGIIFEDEPIFNTGYWTWDNKYAESLNQWVSKKYGHPAWSYSNAFFRVAANLKNTCTCSRKKSLSGEGSVDSLSSGGIMGSQDLVATPSGIRLQSNTVWMVDLGSDVLMEFMPIPAGSFTMGLYNYRVNEMPEHQVTFANPFWMAKTEVTQAQFQQIMGTNTSEVKGDQHPADRVRLQEAVEFCRRLTERERKAGHLSSRYVFELPSEAQWEYVCRAGRKEDYVVNLDAVAWYLKRWNGKQPPTHPVAQKQPNSWGLYDMYGNVGEWCSDCYHDTYKGAPTDGSRWGDGVTATNCAGVGRGASVITRAKDCRPTFRGKANKRASGYILLGFRPVLNGK